VCGYCAACGWALVFADGQETDRLVKVEPEAAIMVALADLGAAHNWGEPGLVEYAGGHEIRLTERGAERMVNEAISAVIDSRGDKGGTA